MLRTITSLVSVTAFSSLTRLCLWTNSRISSSLESFVKMSFGSSLLVLFTRVGCQESICIPVLLSSPDDVWDVGSLVVCVTMNRVVSYYYFEQIVFGADILSIYNDIPCVDSLVFGSEIPLISEYEIPGTCQMILLMEWCGREKGEKGERERERRESEWKKRGNREEKTLWFVFLVYESIFSCSYNKNFNLFVRHHREFLSFSLFFYFSRSSFLMMIRDISLNDRYSVSRDSRKELYT